MYSGFDEAKVIAVDCVRFFCLPGPTQMASWKITQSKFELPRMFYRYSDDATAADYFFGISCVFCCYFWVFHEIDLSDKVFEGLYNFKHRLDIMSNERECEWSPYSIANAVPWEKLRNDAGVLLELLGEEVGVDIPIFDIRKIISVSEFQVSDETRKLLE